MQARFTAVGLAVYCGQCADNDSDAESNLQPAAAAAAAVSLLLPHRVLRVVTSSACHRYQSPVAARTNAAPVNLRVITQASSEAALRVHSSVRLSIVRPSRTNSYVENNKKTYREKKTKSARTFVRLE